MSFRWIIGCLVVLTEMPTLPAQGEDLDLIREAQKKAQAQLEEGLDILLDHSQWENPWIFESEHFQVRTTRSLAFAKRAAEAVEKMYPFLVDFFGTGDRRIRRIPIHIHPDLPSYSAEGQTINDDATAHHTSSYGCYFDFEKNSMPVVTYDTRSIELVDRFITHGVSHAFLAEIAVEAQPTWLMEGLAGYFAMFWDRVYGDRHTLPLLRSIEDERYVTLENLLASQPSQFDNSRHLLIAIFFHYMLNLREGSCAVYADSGELLSAPFRDYLRKRVYGQPYEGDEMHDLLFQNTLEVQEDFHAYFVENSGR